MLMWRLTVVNAAVLICCSGRKRPSGGGAQTPVGGKRKRTASDEGWSGRTQVTAATELCTTKQGARTRPNVIMCPILNSAPITFNLFFVHFIIVLNVGV